jgi:hypothetical protein
MIIIDGGVGSFVPIVIMMERGDTTGAWSFPNINVLQSIMLCCTVRQAKVIQ